MEDAEFESDDGGAHTLAGPPHRVGTTTRAAATLLWTLGLAVLGVTVYAGWQLWFALQTGYEPLWGHFWTAAFILFGLAMVYIFASMLGPVLAHLRPFQRATRSRAERVQAAALTGDNKLTPLAAAQPEPLTASALPIGAVTFGPFAPTRRHNSRPSLGRSFAFLLATVGVTAVVVAAYVLASQFLDDGPFMAWMRPMFLILLGLFALTALISVGQFLLTLVRRLRGAGRVERMRLIADDWGLRPLYGKRGKERQAIAWHEVRAFYKADDLLRLHSQVISKGMPQKTTYTIATGERTLSWTLWEDAPAQQRADSEHLCRLIVTRTKLPLRDVTAFTTQLAAEMIELVSPLLLAFPDRRMSLEIQQDIPEPAAAPVANASDATSALRPPTTFRRVGATWPRWLMPSRVAALSIAVLTLVAGMAAHGIQSYRYLNLLHQQIGREVPYYDIDFRTNDGAWPNHAATANDGSYTFRTDGYYMTGAPGGRAMEAVLPQQYSDATVKLTAGLTNVVPATDIGVVLRESDDGTDKVVFALSSSGGWSLIHLQTASGAAPRQTVLLSNDHSDSVRTGKGSYNYLAVIMRGPDYLCFVRDNLVGIYHDPSSQPLRQGHVGLWLGNSHAVGWFSYFSVYPAQ